MDIVGIVGAGTMGNGIAQVAALHGHNVIMYDVNMPLAQHGFDSIKAVLKRHVEKKRLDAAEMNAALERVRLTADLNELKDAQLVIEAVPEDLALKRSLFSTLDHLCLPDTLLCSNTSSLSIAALGGVTKRPDKVAGLHFFNPAPMMSLVEVVRSDRTSAETVSRLIDVARRWGKTPIVARDTPGFIVNRVARPFYAEALRLLDHHVADAETIDRIMKAAGFKMGPFELMDLVGIDVNLAVTEAIYEAYF
ncbi:MAG TPA: 3-hydroxyacyl-CoA dehydrogenase NAD-binding domain-containing protein, partial [Anaerolineae bacterium]|nr:3-hydroxyacyl-CoA dehydrogenase NAD-binding domain-containing protein [Anaerolineae bacterium]